MCVCEDRLRVLDVSKNRRQDDVQGHTGLTGALDVVRMCEKLEKLKLDDCRELTGKSLEEKDASDFDEEPLSTLIHLTHIDVHGCAELKGGFSPTSMNDIRAPSMLTGRVACYRHIGAAVQAYESGASRCQTLHKP